MKKLFTYLSLGIFAVSMFNACCPKDPTPEIDYLSPFHRAYFMTQEDVIEDGYFGCGGVAKIPNLQDKLIKLARGGFKHHTSVGMGHMQAILKEAFTTYLGYDWVEIDA